MSAARKHGVEVYSERSRFLADGGSSRMNLRFTDDVGPEVTLTLTRGSFSPDERVRTASFNVQDNGEVDITIFAPRRPGVGYLTGPKLKHRLDFVAVSFVQGLIFEWVPTLAIALVLALVLRTWAVASFYIPSGSMEDTLRRGDLLIADKLSYKLLHHDPERGDVMIFRYPRRSTEDPNVDYIKRIIGLPGDVVEVRGGQVFVNGAELHEEYIKEPPLQDYGPKQVPRDKFFVMGDNRNKSSDSRVWGFVPRDHLEGRALFVFWPLHRAKLIRNGLEGDEVPDASSLGLESELR